MTATVTTDVEQKVPFNDLSRLITDGSADTSRLVASVATSGRYLLGEWTERFERQFADYIGVAYAVAVANGTDALELSLRAVGCRPGDEVVTVANAGMYSTIACLAVGATPVYADICPDSLLLSIDSAVRAIGKRTRAIVVTHLYGNVVDVDELRRRLGRRIPIVEDCAQAHGASLGGRKTGSLGDIAAFSFYPTKNLGAIGDAGGIATSNEEFCQRIRQLRQYGWSGRFLSTLRGGRNSRMDEIQAAVLCTRLQDLDARNRKRVQIENEYRACAAGTRFRFPDRGSASPVAHLCIVRHEERDIVRSAFRDRGIQTAIHYPVPDFRQPSLPPGQYRIMNVGHTERACREILSLPCFPELQRREIDLVCQALRQIA